MLPSLPPRLIPVNGDAEKQLRQRTLTNLYNTRPPGFPISTKLSMPGSSLPTAGPRQARPRNWVTRRGWSVSSN